MNYTCLTPGRIGTLEIPNRLIFPAMVTNYCDEGGFVNERFIAYHMERARGGVGLLTMEATVIRQDGRSFARQLSIESDQHTKGLQALTRAIHEHGAKTAIQLYHAGRQTTHAITGVPMIAPSVLTFGKDSTRAMDKADIDAVIADFAAAAARAQEAGFDAIELHGGHGYLLQQFLSPFTNFRTDAYGGNFENRARFTQEVIRAIRGAVGANLPIILRMSVEEPVLKGLTIEEGIAAAQLYAREAIDAVHVSAGMREAGMWVTPPLALPQGIHTGRAARVRKAINQSIPVIAVGRIKTLAHADTLLREGKADFIAMGRALLADPALPRKTQQGHSSNVRPCIACNEGCIGQLSRGMEIGCAVNPLLGRENEHLPTPAAQPCHVVVVGGGPGGMVAACTARARGYSVTLLEQKNTLGGRLLAAALPPHKHELNEYCQYLQQRVRALGIRVLHGKHAEAASIVALKPEHVILAVGAKPFIPAIQDINTIPYMLAEEVLQTDSAQVGTTVVILGGGLVGCETAEFLASKGKRVTIIEMREALALDIEPRSRELLLRRLRELGIAQYLSTRVVRVGSGIVEIESYGETRVLSGNETVVIAAGYTPDTSLRAHLNHEGLSVMEAGDCAATGRILEAVTQGFNTACVL